MAEIERRQFLIAAGALLATPLTSLAQPSVRRIGFLAGRSRSTPSSPDPYYDAFADELRKLGYVEGKNIIIQWRFAEGKYDRLPQLASELVQTNVEVIVTHSTPLTRVAQRATSTIPIVTTGVGDPVMSGFADSLAQPGRNITGVSQMIPDLIPKQFELLKALLPGASHVAALMNPTNPNRPRYLKNLEDGARRFGMDIVPENAQSPDEIRRAFAAMAQSGAHAVIIAADGYFSGQAHLLAELGISHRLPSIGTYREHVKAGVLISYGDNIAASHRRAAVYVDRILKGAKPGELPMEQPTRIHLAINRKTAKALGLSVPRELLLRADEVFE